MTREGDPEFDFDPAGLAPFSSLKHTMEPESKCQSNRCLRVRLDYDMRGCGQIFTVWRRCQAETLAACEERV